MALFINQLAFTGNQTLLAAAKLDILLSSPIAPALVFYGFYPVQKDKRSNNQRIDYTFKIYFLSFLLGFDGAIIK